MGWGGCRERNGVHAMWTIAQTQDWRGWERGRGRWGGSSGDRGEGPRDRYEGLRGNIWMLPKTCEQSGRTYEEAIKGWS